ncbi:MAG: hypothetical protein QGG48_00595 [Desulfatiglandales bacterium]|nr:hypothetical protein [Desulfatiglandales bacterium]
MSVADVYDALCSHRVYKTAWNEGRVLEEIGQSSGKHFDPEVTDAFFSCIDVLKSVTKCYPGQDQE